METTGSASEYCPSGDSTETTQGSISGFYPTKYREEFSDANVLAPCSLLWRATLAQAVRDIYSSNPKDREGVVEWMKSEDFLTVCEYACVEPDNMLEQMGKLLALPIPLAKKYGITLRMCVMRGVHWG